MAQPRILIGMPAFRGANLEFGLGMLETLWPAVLESERLMALCTVLDRLCLPRNGRFFFYDGPTIPLASDFILKALERFPIPSVERAFTGAQPESFAGCLAGELLDQAIHFSNFRREVLAKEQTAFRFRSGDEGIDLLLDGWSIAEPWGIWSDGPCAALRLPVGTKRGQWKAIITFQAFGKKRTVPLELTMPSSSQVTTWRVAANQVVQKELCVESQCTDTVLRFAFPEAISPKRLGLSDDRRCLGIGLISMDLTEPA